MGDHHSTLRSSLHYLRGDAGAHSAWSLELGERRGARSPIVPVASGASLASERLHSGCAPNTLALGQGSVWLRGRRLYDSHQGRRGACLAAS
jgi:hypothetical protein